jgi:HSP20 family protein
MNLLPRRSLFDFDDLGDLWAPLRSGLTHGGTLFPRVDVKEKKDSFEISAEMPGVKKEDIHVELRDGVLTIQAESRQEDKEEKDGKLIRQERRYGRFLRSFDLGPGVSESDIKANFTDGVLSVSAPKPKPAAPQAKRIDVG